MYKQNEQARLTYYPYKLYINKIVTIRGVEQLKLGNIYKVIVNITGEYLDDVDETWLEPIKGTL